MKLKRIIILSQINRLCSDRNQRRRMKENGRCVALAVDPRMMHRNLWQVKNISIQRERDKQRVQFRSHGQKWQFR